jgi:hypothetical protein
MIVENTSSQVTDRANGSNHREATYSRSVCVCQLIGVV